MDDAKQRKVWGAIEAAIAESAVKIASIISALDEQDRLLIERQLDGIISLEDLNEKRMMKPGRLH